MPQQATKKKDTLWTTIDRVIKLDETSGTRGTMVEVTGKGFSNGTSTLFLQELYTEAGAKAANEIPGATVTDREAGDLKGGRIPLGSANTSGGTFTLVIDTTADDFKTGTFGAGDDEKGVNQILAVDSTGAETDKPANFEITGKVDVEPDSVARAGTLTIKLSDWTTGVSRVTIGGKEDCVPDVSTNMETTGVQRCFLDDDGALTDTPPTYTGEKVEFKVQVPTTVPLGTQQVAVYGRTNEKDGTSEVAVSAQELTASPTTVARGQSVSISGSGFMPNGNNTSGEITKITVGGVAVPSTDNIGNIDVVSGGNVNFIITIPKNKSDLRDGENTILVTAWNGGVGSVRVNIPKAEITLDPPMGRRGTEVEVSGTGFFAGELVLIEYDGSSTKRVGSALADSTGSFTLEFDVPNVAEIGKTQTVTAVAELSGGEKISAEADHSTPDATISISPASAPPGAHVTITGIDFPLFTAVKELSIDGLPVLPVPAPITDGDGKFTADVVVPQAEIGDRTVLATVGTTTKTAFLKVSDKSISQDPTDVFADLIVDSRLTRVWYFDNATQVWSFFDPAPEFADFNTLTQVTSGQIVTIIVNEGDNIEFDSTPATLYPGTNQVALD